MDVGSKQFPRDFRVGDTVFLKSKEIAHIVEAFDEQRFSIFLQQDKFFQKVKESEIETLSPVCVPLVVEKIDYKQVSDEFISWRLINKREGDHWEPVTTPQSSSTDEEEDLPTIPLSFDWELQLENCDYFNREEHAVFVFIEGTVCPRHSLKGKVLCYLEIYQYTGCDSPCWPISGPTFGPSATNEFKALVRAKVKKYMKSSGGKNRMANFLMCEMGFSVLNIASIPEDVKKSGAKEDDWHDDFIAKGKPLDDFKTKLRQWVKDGVKVKATY